MAASPFSQFESPSPGSEPASPQRLPARIGKYEVERETGCGDLVRVFLAFDRDIDRPVTLKLLTGVADAGLTQRFRREVAGAAKLRAPGVAAIYELGEHVGLPFAAMQVPAGKDLRAAMPSDRLTLLEKLRMMWQVAEAVEALHTSGLQHVGLRPAGISVDEEGRATIHDFGMVRVTPEEGTDRTAYASPEEWAGGEPDAVSDIFVFGELFYELLAGVHPFPSRGSDPKPLTGLVPECPEAFARIVHRCLERRRELRYQGVEEMRDDAEPVLRELMHDRAAALLAEVRARMQAHDLDSASSLLREILQLDPENRDAQRLRTDLRGLMRRESVRPRLTALLQEAGQLAGARSYGRALELLESAAQLDPADPALQARVEEMREQAERERRSLQLAAEARELLAQRKLTEAYGKASQALEVDSANPEFVDLVHSIADTIERRKKETRLEEGIAKAKSLLLAESFDGAISILLGLRAEAPDSPLVEQWLEHVRKHEAEARKRSGMEQKLRKAQTLLVQERFNSAILMLGDLATEFPGERRITDLLDQACMAKDRASAVLEATTDCEQLRRTEQYEKALEVLDATLAKYPGEASLMTLRHEIEEQWRNRRCGVAVQKALEESRWLREKDRPDLALECLRDACVEFPEQPELMARVQEIENLLPDWENRRFVQDTLRRAGALEELEQWEVALTVLEEALGSCPASGELLDAALRLRSHLQEQERRRKLARRLEMIGQKIDARAWSHALLLIESAELEFPDSPELEARRKMVQEGSRRSEADILATTVRQLMADGETAQAEEALLKGLEAFGDDPALVALCGELETDKKHQEDWHTAQVLFGRRQFDEAERILLKLAGQNHRGAAVLLDKVREARAATEEDSFYKRGREKALRLVQQEQYEQAADLLRNLLTLFPGDAILERDLHTAQSSAPAAEAAAPAVHEAVEPAPAMPAPAVPAPVRSVPAIPLSILREPVPQPSPGLSEPAPPAVPEPKQPAVPPVSTMAVARTAEPSEAAPVDTRDEPEAAPSVWAIPKKKDSALEFELTFDLTAAEMIRRGAIPVAACLVLVLVGALIWKTSRHPARLPKKADITTVTQQRGSSPPAEQSSADRVVLPATLPERPREAPSAAKTKSKPAPALPKTPSASSHRAFDPSSLTKRAEAPTTTAAALPPAAAVSMGQITPAVSSPVLSSPSAPSPTGDSQTPANPNPVAPIQNPTSVAGGKFEPAKLLSGAMPAMPSMARQLGVHGVVNLEITIDTTGLVKNVRVVSGHNMLASAARDTVRHWRYQPATLNGKVIDSKVAIRVVFEEKGK